MVMTRGEKLSIGVYKQGKLHSEYASSAVNELYKFSNN